MGIFGSYSKRDEQHYKRLAAQDSAKEARRRKISDWLPFRKETLARVKAGEITLEEGQRLIAKRERDMRHKDSQ